MKWEERESVRDITPSSYRKHTSLRKVTFSNDWIPASLLSLLDTITLAIAAIQSAIVNRSRSKLAVLGSQSRLGSQLLHRQKTNPFVLVELGNAFFRLAMNV